MAFVRILTKPPNQCQRIWSSMNDHSFLDAVQVHPIFVMCSILKTEQVQYLSHFHFAQYLRQAHVACQGPRNRIAQIGQYLGFIKQPHIWWAESVQLTKFHRRTWLISSDTENLWVSSYWSTSVNEFFYCTSFNSFEFYCIQMASYVKFFWIKKDLLLMHCTSCKCDVKW